eukprot:941640-Prymnesium_polylepis.1
MHGEADHEHAAEQERREAAEQRDGPFDRVGERSQLPDVCAHGCDESAGGTRGVSGAEVLPTSNQLLPLHHSYGGLGGAPK